MNNEHNIAGEAETAALLTTLSLYKTADQPCSYINSQQSNLLFADPYIDMTLPIYNRLALLGFRRSGTHIYKPACKSCTACIPTRIPAHEFTPNRSQRRTIAKNADLQVFVAEPIFNAEHFDLYRRYMNARHPGGGMQTTDPEQYMNFLACAWSDTLFYEFRLKKELVCIAIVDRLDTGLSAMYTFYEPNLAQRSLGTFAILWEIQKTCRLGLPWLYLGYWIKECSKMSYKGQFQPLQTFVQGRWQYSSHPP